MKIERMLSKKSYRMEMQGLLSASILALALVACSGKAGKQQSGPAGEPRDTALPAAQKKAEVIPEKSRKDEGVIWQERLAGYQITWTPDDIIARRGGTSSGGYSLKESTEKERKSDSLAVKGSEECVNEQKAKILSVVGPIVSMERSEYSNCPGAAHPNVTTWYVAVDVAKPDKMLKLTDFFEEKDILSALLDDAIVKKTLERANIFDRPKSLEDLMKHLTASPPDCHYQFSDDLLTRFAFHHLENSSVAVRLGLSHGIEACRGEVTQIGLLLPIPKKWEGFLKQAEERKEGFLMKDQKKVSEERGTTFTLK